MRRRRVVKTLPSDSSDEEPLSKIAAKSKPTPPVEDASSSESDIESYLQPANKIDLSSSFFNPQTDTQPSFNQIESNILSGVSRLTDSECEDEVPKEDTIEPIPSTSKLNFGHLHEYAKKIEEAKRHVEEYNARKKAQQKEMNIESLLAAGETKDRIEEQKFDLKDLHSSDFESLSDSDKEGWEEVNDEEREKSVVPKEGLEITVGIPSLVKQKKQVDVLAAIKRRINRVRKENQVLVHKVHLLCWLAHGNFVNSIINSQDVLGVALSLLPSEKCYPPSRTDLDYLEKFTKWFSGAVVLSEKPLPVNRSLAELLQTQITKKEAFNKTMLVYIFVATLRSLGIACRLVLSLQVEPLRPPNSELLSLSTKTDNEKESKKVKNKIDVDSTEATDVKNQQGKLKPKATSRSKSVSELKVEDSKTKKGRSKSTDPIVKPEQQKTEKSNKKQTNVIKIKLPSPKRSKSKSPKPESSNSDLKRPTTRSRSKPPKSGSGGPKQTSKSKSKAVVPQLDGSTDDAPSKPNLKKLSQKEPPCRLRLHPQRLKSITKFRDSDSEDDFASRSPFSTKNDSPKTNGVNLKKLKSNVPKVDVKQDIVNIVKRGLRQQKAAAATKTVKKRRSAPDSGDDSDYMPEVPKKKKESEDDFSPKVKVKRRVQVKPEPEKEVKKKKGDDVWAEVFCESEEKWICVDVVKAKIHCVKELSSRATQPISYIVAWNNDGTLKDVTRRYCLNFNTITRKLRTDTKWWTDAVSPFMGRSTARDNEEEDQLERQHLEKPLPKTISEYKNHPLYVLKRHLLKFEALYPPDAPTVGFIRNEPVYLRRCVYTLHSRDIWLKHAKVVKPGEQPYKIVKARPRWDKLSNSVVTGELLEIFGPWQTQDYEPPTAENGVVPRNAFGNVELFKPCMLPKKTVHLQLPGLNKVARKMNIDCAPALVGFDFHGGWNHPTYDGYVVCEEFADVLVAAWDIEQEEIEKREQEKIDKRVYGNWKRLIKGLLIRERLKAKYEFGESSESGGGGKKKGKGLPKLATKK